MKRPNGDRAPLASRRTATAIKSATQTWNLNADETVVITVESPFTQQYEIGDKITVFGRDYTLNRLPPVKKTGMHEYQYTLTFEGIQYDLLRVQYELSIETSGNKLQDVQGDSLTGTLRKFMEVLIANANRVFPGQWSLGECPETEYKTLTFDGENCLAVMQNLCNEFTEGSTTVEFDINKVNGVYVVDMKKVGSVLPYTFQFGRGGGVYELTRQNVTSSDIVTKLYVFGSSENISLKYRADRLCLPGCTKHQSFIQDNALVAKYGIIEGRKVFDKIKPHYDGNVTSIVAGNVLQFVDSGFPFDLMAKNGDETIYLVPGENAKIHFNTGNLAGYEFEVTNYEHSTRKFTLKKFQDDRGDVFPNDSSTAFQFGQGNEYKILGIIYPDSITKAAEYELQEESALYYPQVSQPKVQYALSLEKNFLKKLVGGDVSNAIVNAFVPGDYLHIIDHDIDVDKSIRIKGFTRDILDEYKYTLTISDTVTTSTTTRVLQELAEIDKIIQINNLKDPARARANWRTSREVLDMVFDPDGDYYTDRIKPLSIDTSMLSVGAKSMQFGLTNTVIQPNFGGNKNVVSWKGGVLTHYTINEDSAVSWIIADGSITFTDDNARYLYAKCERNGTAGTFLWSNQQIKVEDDANYYHFLIGTLSSVDTELQVRSIALTYGFTTINGRFIKTGRIESADGTTYFDLDNSEIGGRIVFSQNGQEKTLEELGNEAMESKDFINNTLPGILDEIKAQLDGQIEQHFYQIDPSPLSTAPGSEDGVPNSGWTDSTTKENHLGDLYYNTTSGKVWRYVKIQWRPKPGFAPGTFYVWQELQDSELAQAIAIANEALELGKEKNRIFTSTPVTPYDVGDLWVQGATGDIMRCKTARESGAFTSSDWEKASKYTDDSALKNFINGDFANAIDTMTEQIDGKIETWFQTSDPASNWTTDAEKAKHVGDMWYNSSTKLLKCYRKTFRFVNGIGTVAYTWQTIEDKKAIDAYDAASKAQDTADGKRRVFVAQPYPPYDVGDLWVDGKELRRCITERASGSWNTNDWVVAVYYDNTQTTIDGGIVTSGTIQVAGDNKSILAGITGNGTASDSIRFWAGASFENRKTAPFRVMQDGSVVMSKAQVEGVINAITGSIGGFRIQQGQIGYGGSDEQDATNGLALLRDFIRFKNDKQRVLLGCLSSLGYPFNGLLSLTDQMGTTLELHHDNPSTSDANSEHWYHPKALGVYGNQFNIGKVAAFENGYIGQAYTDTIELWFAITQKYHFTANTTKYLNVNLPTLAQVNKQTNNVPTIFDIEIVCDRNMGNRIRVSPQNGCYLYNNDGDSIDGIAMARGDSLTLRYYNGGWMIVNQQN